MSLSIKNIIIAAVTLSAAIAAAPHAVKTPGAKHHHNQSYALSMLHGAKGTALALRGLAKTSQQMEWVETSSANFLYSPATNAWSLDFRDTSLYDSQGRPAVVKTSLAHAGWNIDSLYEIDSTVWRGSQPQEYDSLFFYNGTLDSASCVRLTFSYSADRTAFVSSQYVYGAASWIMVGVDSLSCGSPITDPTFYYYNDSAKFISYRSYAASDAGGALMLVSSMTKINAESNATRLALSLFTAGGTMDSSKIFETISTSAQIITSDSVMVKSPSGVWTDYSRASNSFSAGGDWFYRLQMVRQGAWVTTDSIVSLALGSGYEIYRPSPDSLSTYFWDEWGNDTLEVTAIKTDTTYRHWINTYDDNDNIIREVGYTSDKSGSNKLKTDSSAFTNAQIRISSVRRNRIFSAADAVSFEQTPAMLRVWAAGITGLRLYDLSGRMLASVNQLPAPTIFFTWHSLRTRSAKQLYAAQVITGRGIITQTLRNISQF